MKKNYQQVAYEVDCDVNCDFIEKLLKSLHIRQLTDFQKNNVKCLLI